MFPPSRKMFVDNEWVAASNGATYAVPNPATEEAIGTAPEATVEDMRRAIAAARRAFDEGPWPRSSRQERARVITAIADGMERRKEELRQMLIAEAGATYLTHDIQLEQPIRLLRNYADLALTFDFEEPLPVRVTDGPLGTFVCSSIVHRQPAGVCGLIPTWNLPLFVTVQKLGPALATGCTMVFKPSPYGPLVNLMLAEIVADADLPPGVVNFVTGQSNAIAETLVTDPRIDKVSFTGSVATGKKIMAAAAATLKRVHLELGGKPVAIVLDTDDLDPIAPTAGSASPTTRRTASAACASAARRPGRSSSGSGSGPERCGSTTGSTCSPRRSAASRRAGSAAKADDSGWRSTPSCSRSRGGPDRLAESPADGRRPRGGEPFLPLSGIEWILPGQTQLEIRKIVVPPEELVADLHRRNPEHAAGDRVVRLPAEARLRLGGLRLRDERRALKAELVAEAFDDHRVTHVEA